MDEGLAVASERRKWRARGDELLARIKEGDESIADRAALCFAKSGDAASEAFCRGVEWRRRAARGRRGTALDFETGRCVCLRGGGALDVCADLLEQLGEAELAEECRNADGTARLLAEARAAERERAEIAGKVVAIAKQARQAARERPMPPRTPLSSAEAGQGDARNVARARRAAQEAENKRRAEEQAARAAIARAEAEAAEKRRAEVAKAEAARREVERKARAERLEKERLAQAQRDAERAEARRLAAEARRLEPPSGATRRSASARSARPSSGRRRTGCRKRP